MNLNGKEICRSELKKLLPLQTLHVVCAPILGGSRVPLIDAQQSSNAKVEQDTPALNESQYEAVSPEEELTDADGAV